MKLPKCCASAGLIVALLLPICGWCQITPAQADQLRAGVADRIEAPAVLGGDYLLGGGTFHSRTSENEATFNVSKFGGSGEFGDLQELGSLNIAWRPRVMGNMGTDVLTNHFNAGLLAGDVSKSKAFGIQFGGGARLWFTDEFSLAPTLVGMYGHTTNEYTAASAFMVANLATAKEVGLIDWTADTWTVRPSLNVQYLFA